MLAQSVVVVGGGGGDGPLSTCVRKRLVGRNLRGQVHPFLV